MCHHDVGALDDPNIKPLVLFLHRGFAGGCWQVLLLETGDREALSAWDPESPLLPNLRPNNSPRPRTQCHWPLQ